MHGARTLLVVSLALGAASTLPTDAARADGEATRRDPTVGLLYPAGGRRGTTFQILAGGQNLRGASAAYVSGQGVTAAVVRFVAPLSPQQMQELRRRLLDAGSLRRGGRRAERDPDAEKVELPDHPLLKDLDSRSPKELRAIAARFLGAGAKKQQNRQLAETVEIDVTIDADAAPGDRELRLGTPSGLTNPMRFQVGVLPEVRDEESQGDEADAATVLDLPVLLNGQIQPGDADRFRFRAKRGRRIVVDCAARRLVPYLADAVPGWFQATAALYDARGREVAYADDFRFEPDPVFAFDVPADGEYVLEIHDALWRGREDFVYRFAVGEAPFVTQIFPLGARVGAAATAAVVGWNLPARTLALDTSPGPDALRCTSVTRGDWPSNGVPYAVDDLPEIEETESDAARRIEPPTIVNGRIGAPGDVDVFEFEGRAGEDVVAEVVARKLRSPLDAVVSLTDAAGRVLAWNDDSPDAAMGLFTHHADPHVAARLPADGVYRVVVAEVQRHGGPEFAYRLRVSAPRPDFEVYLTPSSLSVPPGLAAAVRARVVRRDGFDGPIALTLADAPAGFSLAGATIPAGADSARLTLAARDGFDGPRVLRLEAVARIGGADVRHPVVPADDRMQAFAYRHLVPAQELMAAPLPGRRGAPSYEFVGDGPVRIPVGGAVRVRLRGRRVFAEIGFELDQPPAGVTLEDAAFDEGGASFALRAAPDAKVGTSDNLIVEVVATSGGRGARGAGKAERRTLLGVLPALAVEIAGGTPAVTR